MDPSLIYNDRVVIPRGTEAHVRMAENKKGGHLHGKAKVALELVGLVMNGRKLEVVSDTYQKDQGVLAAKIKAAAPASAGAGANMATGTDPGSAVSPVIAIFHAARVDLQPNTRVEFSLTAPFTFVKPPADSGKRINSAAETSPKPVSGQQNGGRTLRSPRCVTVQPQTEEQLTGIYKIVASWITQCMPCPKRTSCLSAARV